MNYRSVGQIASAVVAAMLCTPATTPAADIYMWVSTTKHGWALLVPGSGTGGKVVFSRTYDCRITDRVIRGELVQAGFMPSAAVEYFGGNATTWLSSKAGVMPLVLEPLRPGTGPGLPATATFKMPTSPSWDNNHINIATAAGTFSTRIPLGSGSPR